MFKIKICLAMWILFLSLVLGLNGDGGGREMVLDNVVVHLPGLYTKNKRGRYVRILNKDGRMTKKYDGGIYLQKGNLIRPVHKMMVVGHVTSNVNQQPKIPSTPPPRMGRLLTRTRDNRYVPILKRRGGITERYKGGIYLKDLTRDSYKPIHKLKERGWIRKKKKQGRKGKRRHKKRGRRH